MLPLAIMNAVLACALLAFLCLIWLFGSRIRIMDGNIARRQREMERRIEELSALLRELASDVESQRAISAARVPAASLNLNKRSQAIAMLRRGEAPESVASALELPVVDVRLLMKVHGALASGTDGSVAPMVR